MNKQRKVVITITYNEMGIIVDTKAEEVAQSELFGNSEQMDGEYDPKPDIYYLAEKIGIHRLYALVAQLQPTCNNLATDLVSRKAVRDMVSDWAYDMMEQEDMEMALQDVDELPPAQGSHSDFADLRAEQEERNIISPVLHPVKETRGDRTGKRNMGEKEDQKHECKNCKYIVYARYYNNCLYLL